ncbi:MAG: xanthine phosphoribosyltransferase [Rhodospirillales bacterium CG15_BIG_FIL_POST_REV_8_21_14_020_66_15]|nr:MAG: xanthine phosphoribosyltransferase [Rhodospirillales bacterium CG15_BIG_FIL_POST_REV_8_21_14_020_66_15]
MPADPRTERAVTWAEVQADSRALARRLLSMPPNGPWKGVVAITRGGMVPAAVVAREMGIRIVDTLSVASYDGREQGRVRVLKTPEAAVVDRGAGWLLVDDLVDTGATAQVARDLLPKALFVTLYAKPAARDLPDIFIHEVAQHVWVNFPWDTEERDGALAYAPPLAGAAAS